MVRCVVSVGALDAVPVSVNLWVDQGTVSFDSLRKADPKGTRSLAKSKRKFNKTTIVITIPQSGLAPTRD